MSSWIDIADATTAVEEGSVAAYHAGGTPVALFKIEGQFFALHDLCSHGAAKLSEGFVEGNCIECPLHQGLVEIATGLPKSAPITDPIRALPVRIVGGRLEVEV